MFSNVTVQKYGTLQIYVPTNEPKIQNPTYPSITYRQFFKLRPDNDSVQYSKASKLVFYDPNNLSSSGFDPNKIVIISKDTEYASMLFQLATNGPDTANSSL
jgi:hypothetical protein